MGYLTRIPGVPDKDDIVAGMAHWPVLGACSTTCDTCKYFILTRGKKCRCRLYQKMMGGRQGAEFFRGQKACKYHE